MVDIEKLSALDSAAEAESDNGGIDIMQAIESVTKLIGKAQELHKAVKPQQAAQQIPHVAVAPAPLPQATQAPPQPAKMQTAQIPVQPVEVPAQSKTEQLNSYYDKVLTFLPLIKMAWGDLTLTQLEAKLRDPEQRAEILVMIGGML